MYKSLFLQTLFKKGLIYQGTNLEALDDLASKESIVGYIGFDLTADSLHVGSLYPLMLLRVLQQTGHTPMVVLGGATTVLGDPSGRTTTRSHFDVGLSGRNAASLMGIFYKMLDLTKGGVKIINNINWYKDLSVLDFMRGLGSHFHVNTLLTLDSIKTRLERNQPLTVAELSYVMFQSYDFVTMANRYGCCLQMGASDQWGNIVSGLEFSKKCKMEPNGTNLYGLTCPLLIGTNGQKMGKSVDGAVWLNEDKTSNRDFWQYWRNVPDEDAPKLLRAFVELPDDEIERLCALSGREINEAKKVLATEVTALVRNRKVAEQELENAEKGFERNDVTGFSKVEFNYDEFPDELYLADLLVLCGICTSKTSAKALINAGGIKVNDMTENINRMFFRNTLDGAKISKGKKQHIYLNLYVKP